MQEQSQDQGYGVGLLDDLHQLFPELLYDNVLFPHDDNSAFGRVLNWMRFRLTHLYPQTFTRARQAYTTNTAAERRDEYDEWQWLRNVRNANIVRTPPSINRISMSPLQASLNNWTTTAATTAFGQQQQQQGNHIMFTPPTATAVDGGNRILSAVNLSNIIRNTMIDDIVGTLLIQPQGVSNAAFWANFYDRIPVNPSAAEINAGSRLVESSVVAADAICTICQERESPQNSPYTRDISGASWRQLVNCQHMFHKSCIDRWFREHVVCPVCRADVRVVPSGTTVPTASTVPTVPTVHMQQDQNSPDSAMTQDAPP